MYVYIETEPGLWTVGHYDPAGQWHPDSDHPDKEAAALRVHYLNVGSVGNPWEDDPDWPVEEWMEDVRGNNTRLGYLDWVAHQRETAEDWRTSKYNEED
jgi:FAD/FMN-containing dehydrogenase